MVKYILNQSWDVFRIKGVKELMWNCAHISTQAALIIL